MELGELDAGLNALDVVRITRESTGTPNALVVDGVPLVIGSGGPAAVADTYAANARFFEFDIHYRVGKLGSVSEIPGPP